MLDYDELALLGNGINRISGIILRVIEKSVKEAEKERSLTGHDDERRIRQTTGRNTPGVHVGGLDAAAGEGPNRRKNRWRWQSCRRGR